MSIIVHRPAGANVTKENPIGVLYLSSGTTPPPLIDDIHPDGSIRLVPSSLDEFHFQRKMNGIWGDASLLASSSSLRLGRDLSIESAGSWIQTTSNSQSVGAKRLIPHVHYNNNIGSFGIHAPAVAKMEFRHIFIGELDEQTEGTVLTTTLPGEGLDSQHDGVFVTKMYLTTGTIAATDEVTLSIHNTSELGAQYFKETFPASTFPANSEIELDFYGVIQVVNVSPTFFKLSSNQPISIMRSNTAGGIWWLGADIQSFRAYKLLEDRMVLNKRAGMILSRAGNFITTTRVRN